MFNFRRLFLILTPYLWLGFFFLVPFIIVLKISLSDYAISIPPYTPTLDLSQGWAGIREFLDGLDAVAPFDPRHVIDHIFEIAHDVGQAA